MIMGYIDFYFYKFGRKNIGPENPKAVPHKRSWETNVLVMIFYINREVAEVVLQIQNISRITLIKLLSTHVYIYCF